VRSEARREEVEPLARSEAGLIKSEVRSEALWERDSSKLDRRPLKLKVVKFRSEALSTK
jgi:hypothetical protein